MQVYEVDDQIKIARTIIVSHKNKKNIIFCIRSSFGYQKQGAAVPTFNV
jgi:hypothetical protein